MLHATVLQYWKDNTMEKIFISETPFALVTLQKPEIRSIEATLVFTLVSQLNVNNRSFTCL